MRIGTSRTAEPEYGASIICPLPTYSATCPITPPRRRRACPRAACDDRHLRPERVLVAAVVRQRDPGAGERVDHQARAVEADRLVVAERVGDAAVCACRSDGPRLVAAAPRVLHAELRHRPVDDPARLRLRRGRSPRRRPGPPPPAPAPARPRPSVPARRRSGRVGRAGLRRSRRRGELGVDLLALDPHLRQQRGLRCGLRLHARDCRRGGRAGLPGALRGGARVVLGLAGERIGVHPGHERPMQAVQRLLLLLGDEIRERRTGRARPCGPPGAVSRPSGPMSRPCW